MKGHVTAECRELLPCGSWSHICAPTCFQPQGCCPVIGQVRPQVRGRPYLQRHEFFCFTLITRATKNPKSAVIKTFTLLCYLQTGPTLSDVTCCVRLHSLLYVDAGSCLAKFATGETFSYLQTGASTPNNVVSISTGLKYASYPWVIPHKPTARAIQKDVLYKKEGKYGAYRKLTTAIRNVFNDTQLRLIFTSLIHFTKRFERVNKSGGVYIEKTSTGARFIPG